MKIEDNTLDDGKKTTILEITRYQHPWWPHHQYTNDSHESPAEKVILMCQSVVNVLICARNEEKYIKNTLDSIFQQNHPPNLVIVVDDGSRDATLQILTQYREKQPRLIILRRKDRGFSAIGTPLMANTYNTALKFLNDKKYDYLLIIGADTILPRTYIEDLLQEMEREPNLGILSGHDASEYFSPDFPRGSGRLIRATIMKKMRLFPLIYSWENYVVFFAMAMGFTVRCDERFTYQLQRPTGRGAERHLYWGRVMKEMGYHPLYVLGRMIAAIGRGQLGLAAKLFIGYLTTTYPQEIIPIRNYYSQYQKWYLPRLLLRRLHLLSKE